MGSLVSVTGTWVGSAAMTLVMGRAVMGASVGVVMEVAGTVMVVVLVVDFDGVVWIADGITGWGDAIVRCSLRRILCSLIATPRLSFYKGEKNCNVGAINYMSFETKKVVIFLKKNDTAQFSHDGRTSCILVYVLETIVLFVLFVWTELYLTWKASSSLKTQDRNNKVFYNYFLVLLPHQFMHFVPKA